jgi:hypothetical protein
VEAAPRPKADTLVAEKNAFRKLDALRTQGHCPAKVIRRSLENGWAGLFADERGTETRADRATPAIKAVGVIQRDTRTEEEIDCRPARANGALRHESRNP